MTKAQAIEAYASAYKAWLYGRMSDADLAAAKLRAEQLGATVPELARAIRPATL